MSSLLLLEIFCVTNRISFSMLASQHEYRFCHTRLGLHTPAEPKMYFRRCCGRRRRVEALVIYATI